MSLGVFAFQCVILCAIFGVFVFGLQMINPVTFVSDYPPEIQEQYYRSQKKEAVRAKLTTLMLVKKILAMLVFAIVFAWMSHSAGASGFWESLLCVYGYMLALLAFDTLFLDWVLFANIKRIRLPGTENMEKEYRQKWFHVKACLPLLPLFAVGGVIIAGLASLL